MAEFRMPGATHRTVAVGATGTGKTVAAAWLLSKQNFEKRPWVILDFKNEELWDDVGTPPMRPLKLGDMPGKTGLYRMHVQPGDEDALEQWFWDIWRKASRDRKSRGCGLFIDEVSLVPQRAAFKAILRQGRSLRIPVISCTQRPVDVDREVFTESQFKMIFPLEDERDYKIIRGFTRGANIEAPITDANGRALKHWFYWYDSAQRELFTLRPTPKPEIIAADLKALAPWPSFFGV